MRLIIGVVALLLVTGCGDDGPSADNDGEVGGHCYANGTCNVGLNCSAGICVPVDAAVDAPHDAAPDAPPDAYVCATAFEPNDTIQTATATSVATTMNSATITGVAVCPNTDKDHFEVTTTTGNQNLEVVVDFASPGPVLEVSILNSGGTPIANGSVVTGMPQRLRAFTPNLPTGTYYARIQSGGGASNAYQIALNVTGP
jgi:hypothetical protein